MTRGTRKSSSGRTVATHISQAPFKKIEITNENPTEEEKKRVAEAAKAKSVTGAKSSVAGSAAIDSFSIMDM